jgi:5-methylcytosine-specific restriction enzyme A
MARTQGHGNPKWTRDEVILALELYFECGGKVPSGNDPRVMALSDLLRRFPFHAESIKRESFRNPDGVSFKLQNLAQVATGRGLGNVAAADREVWAEFGSRLEELKRIASLIRLGVSSEQLTEEPWEEEQEFPEGRIVTAMHTRRERQRGLRDKLLASRRKLGPLACEICHRPSPISEPSVTDAVFEAHHIVPLAIGQGQRNTRISDLALLCAGCHRALHRLIAKEKRWISVLEAASLLIA